MFNFIAPSLLALSMLISSTEVPPDNAQALIQDAKAFCDDLQYRKCLKKVEAFFALANPPLKLRLDGYFLQGSALAIIGKTVDAEVPFRYLLRAKRDFKIPPELSPKIVAILRKVQVEENAIWEQTRLLERNRILSQMAVLGDNPSNAQGGVPIEFEYRLRDPRAMVESFQLRYRRPPNQEYSSIPFTRDSNGQWAGLIPGEWSENEEGFTLQYYLITLDTEDEPLIGRSSSELPLELYVSPGTLEQAKPFYETTWFWVTSGLGALTVASLVAYLVYENGRATTGNVLISGP